MTDCGCRKGAIRLGCERHDPGKALTQNGQLMAIWRRLADKLSVWRGAA